MFFMLKLKEIRQEKGLLQKDVADILGITQQAAGRLERETRKLDQDQILKLCLALDVTPNELLGFEEAYKQYTDYLQSLTEEEPEN